ncbi:MAG: ATP-dependent DNA helicase, partial [Rhodoferax sp.]|nr:ATP-dependent DNA helicase [Rhodoferax sp.]
KHLHLPQAAVALRQGAGRLIRRESDQGVLVVCDVRLNQMGYGRQLVATLPPMRRLLSPQDFEDALARLTRTSTTDHPLSAPPW